MSIFNWLRDVASTVESFSNANNSAKKQKNQNGPWTSLLGPRESVKWKRRIQKILWDCPFKVHITIIEKILMSLLSLEPPYVLHKTWRVFWKIPDRSHFFSFFLKSFRKIPCAQIQFFSFPAIVWGFFQQLFVLTGCDLNCDFLSLNLWQEPTIACRCVCCLRVWIWRIPGGVR